MEKSQEYRIFSDIIKNEKILRKLRIEAHAVQPENRRFGRNFI